MSWRKKLMCQLWIFYVFRKYLHFLLELYLNLAGEGEGARHKYCKLIPVVHFKRQCCLMLRKRFRPCWENSTFWNQSQNLITINLKLKITYSLNFWTIKPVKHLKGNREGLWHYKYSVAILVGRNIFAITYQFI